MNNDIIKISQADFKVETPKSIHSHDLNIPGSVHNHYAPQESYGDKNGDETVASVENIQPTSFTATVENLPPILQINLNQSSDDPMVKIQTDGTIEYGQNYSPDEAAKTFWKAMSSWGGSNADQLENAIDNLKHIVETTCKPGCYDYDEYMFGMANGLILALATIQNKEPVYLDRPVKLQSELDAQAMVGTQPQQDESKEDESKEDEWARCAAASICDEIDNEIIKDLIEIVEEEKKVTNFERAMKGV